MEHGTMTLIRCNDHFSMPTDSDEEDWYDRRRRLDAEEGISRIGLEGGEGGASSPTPAAQHGPQLRRPMSLARSQAFAMAGLLSDYDDGYEETYRQAQMDAANSNQNNQNTPIFF